MYSNSKSNKLTWTRKGYRLILIGAEQTHEFGGLSVIQGKEAIVVLRPEIFRLDRFKLVE